MPLRAHLQKIRPLDIAAPVYEALDRFRAGEGQRFFPVAHGDGSVAGILRDDSLKGFMFGKYGYQLVNHHPMQDFLSPCTTIPIEATLETALTMYASHPNPDGLIAVEAGKYAGVLPTGSLLRMYEENRMKIQRQLMHSQKMEAIGTLAGGIAHDFNNILMPIMGYAELIRFGAELGDAGKLQRHADQILQATQRARALVEQILSFSRPKDVAEQVFPLAGLIREVTGLLRASMPSTIRIRHRILAGRDAIRADPGRIHQVLMNLCTNAAYAMRETGGTLEIALEDFAADQQDPPEPGRWTCGRGLSLTVTDTGSGIEPEALEHVFEPFFTTKPQGEGTGMGLAVVHGIVKSIGGRITVQSTPGVGTRFRILLPSAEGLPDPVLDAGPPAARPDLPGRGRRVLIVDDEPAITQWVDEVFRQHGFSTEATNSSLAALDRFTRDPGRFDLVVTDRTMPDLSGIDLSRRLLALRPGLPIILFTGYSEDLQGTTARSIGVRAILRKPVSMQRLILEAKSLLGAADRGWGVDPCRPAAGA